MFARSYNLAYAGALDTEGASGASRQKKGPFDFSPESLQEVDELIATLFHAESESGQLGSGADPGIFILGAGAYYGEVIVRNLGGQWKTGGGTQLPGGDRATIDAETTTAIGVGAHSLTERPLVRVAQRMHSQTAPALMVTYRDLEAGTVPGSPPGDGDTGE